jgi:predicted RNA-binding protein YlqC (UPF0109 family)
MLSQRRHELVQQPAHLSHRIDSTTLGKHVQVHLSTEHNDIDTVLGKVTTAAKHLAALLNVPV